MSTTAQISCPRERHECGGGGAQAKGEVKKLTMKLQNRDLEPQPGRTLMESFEAGVNQARTHGLHRSHRRFGEVSGLLPEGGACLRCPPRLTRTGVQPCLTISSPCTRMEASFIPRRTALRAPNC